MPWSGSSYTKWNGVSGWAGDAAAGVGIEAGRHDTQDTDFQDGINACLNKGGLNTPTTNLPMGGYRHTGVGVGVSRTDYAQLAQLQDSSPLWGGTSAGTSTAFTFSLSPAITGYSVGQVFRWNAHTAVTGAATVNINGLGTKTLQRQGTALAGNEFKANDIVEMIYDGTQFQITSVVAAPLFIDRTNNRVGVGLTNPGSTVEVSGTDTSVRFSRYVADANCAAQFFIKSRGASVGTNTIVQSGDQLGRIDFYGANGTGLTPAAAIIAGVDGTPGASNDMPGYLEFFTTPDGSGTLTSRWKVANDGNIGIGVAPSATNRVLIQGADAGSTNFQFRTQDSAGLVGFSIRNDGSFNSGQGVSCPYNNTTASAANMFVGSNGVVQRSTSSLRYKENIETLAKGLPEVLALRPVTFTSKNSDDDKVYGGLIAEEVDAVGLSEFVLYDNQDRPDALHYSNMVSLAFKAIQDLNAKVEALEARIAELEG